MRWVVMVMLVGGCAHQDNPRAKLSQPVREYRTQAWDLELHGPDAMHHDAVRAMHALAGAVRTLPAATEDLARDIDAQADAIAQSSHHANHSGPARAALDDAVMAMERLQKPHPELAGLLRTARASIDQIDPSVPYLQEKQVIDDAFAGVANAMALATTSLDAHTQAIDLHEQRLERYIFDQRGQNPDVMRTCGPAGAQSVVLKRRASDLAFGVLTLGWYTPVHAKVTCRASGATASRPRTRM